MENLVRLTGLFKSTYNRINNTWFFNVVLIPFGITRAALIVAGMESDFFPNYGGIQPAEIVQRGWWFSGNRLLDMWARWDSGWYLNIIEHGYFINGDLLNTQSNLVFYPLFPMLVKVFSFLLPSSLISSKVYLAIGIMLSNILFLLGLALLYKLVNEIFANPKIAEITIIYLLVFPTGFFFSTFYTESTFFFFSVATVYACKQRCWWLAGVCSGLLALSRPTGVLVLLLTGWMYMDSCDWKLSRLRPNILWVGLAPVFWAGFQLYTSNIAGVFGISILNQQAFKPIFSFDFWSYILLVIQDPNFFHKIPALFALYFLILSVMAFWKLPSKGYAVFSISLILVIYLSRGEQGLLRYLLGIFPVFIVTAAIMVNHPRLDRLVRTLLFAYQMILMAGWFNLYPLG